MVEVRELARGLRFPEGPVVLPDGSIAVCQIESGVISRVAPDGDVTEIVGGLPGPNGAALGVDGALYVCDNGGNFEFFDLGGILVPGPLTPSSWQGGSIRRVDLTTGEVTTLYTECDGLPLYAPNDLVVDAEGDIWFTDYGRTFDRSADRTGVFHATADGGAIREVVTPLDSPNGIGLSPDGDRLYVAETHHGRLLAWDVTGPGEVATSDGLNAGGEVLCHPGGGKLFDSLAVDPEGWVCVGTLGVGGITAVSPDGSSVEFVELPDPLVTNVCFGPGDPHTAYVTMSGTGVLAAIDWPAHLD
ncbi:MAG: SMP-30/gluconolactonase/LRE family protein [Acidimicrobiales bacterium]